MPRRWTKEETDWLKNNASSVSITEATLELNRSRGGVSQRAAFLNVKFKPSHKYWDKEEVEWLKANASNHTCGEAAVHLKRTAAAVGTKAGKLNLTFKAVKVLWTDEEVEWLRSNVSNVYLKEASEHLDRSSSSVSHKVTKLGLAFKESTIVAWTEEEVEWLKENVEGMTSADAAFHLKRSIASVKYKIGQLGIKFGKRVNGNGTVRLWTKTEESRLWSLVEQYQLETIGRMLGRSKGAVFNRCKQLGISIHQARDSNVALAEYMGIKVNLLHKYKAKLKFVFMTQGRPYNPTDKQIATLAKSILLNRRSDAAVKLGKLKAAVKDNVVQTLTARVVKKSIAEHGVESLLKDILIEDKVHSRVLAEAIAKMRSSIDEAQETLSYVIREEDKKERESDEARRLCA